MTDDIPVFDVTKPPIRVIRRGEHTITQAEVNWLKDLLLKPTNSAAQPDTKPVAESQAPAVSDSGDSGVATGRASDRVVAAEPFKTGE
jgi:hypothetical protein